MPMTKGIGKPLAVALVIADTHVEIFLIEMLSANSARIQYSKRISLPKNAKTHAQFNSWISSAVFQLIHGLGEHINVKRVNCPNFHIFYSPPVAFFDSDALVIKNDSKEILDETVLNRAVEAAEQSIINRIQNQKNVTIHTSEVSIVERNIANATIEGYPVEHYLMTPCKIFKADLEVTAVSFKLVNKIMEVCQSIFNSSVFHHHTLQFSLSQIISKLTSQKHNLSCVIAENETFCTLNTGSPYAVQQFSIGTDKLMHEASSFLKTTRTVTKSWYSMFSEKKLHGSSEIHFIKALELIGTRWAETYINELQEKGAYLVAPKTVYISSDSRIIDSSISFIRKDKSKFSRFCVISDLIQDFKIESADPSSYSSLNRMIIYATGQNALNPHLAPML